MGSVVESGVVGPLWGYLSTMVMRLGWRNHLTTHLVDIDVKVDDETLQVALCRAGVRLGPPTDASVDCTICNTRSQRSLLTPDE